MAYRMFHTANCLRICCSETFHFSVPLLIDKVNCASFGIRVQDACHTVAPKNSITSVSTAAIEPLQISVS